MKWIFEIVCLTACLAAASATFCKTEDDCSAGRCCVGLTMSGMMKRGLCLRLAKLRGKCSEPESKNDYYGGKFLRYCPCAEGMICEPKNPAVTDPAKRISSLICKKDSGGSTVAPDVSTDSEIVTDDEVVETNPPDEVTDDIVDETLPPEIVTDTPEETEAPEEETEAPEEETEAPEEETEAPEEETEAPEEETEAPEEETEAPEEEVVEEETEAPEEEVVEEETEAPEEEVVEEETEAPEEEVVPEEPEEEVVPEEPEEVVEEGPGGERPRPEDPDCEDWTYGC